MEKMFSESFRKENCKIQFKQSFELKTYHKEKAINFISSSRVMIIHLIIIHKKDKIQMNQYFLFSNCMNILFEMQKINEIYLIM